MGSMTNIYEAPITLGFTPADGDLIGGTVNGVEVNGEWTGTGKTGGVALKRVDDPDTTICSVGFIDGRTVIAVRSDSAPTTDYDLHLYRYVPAGIVQIPQEYVEGLETAASDATAAKTTAETAQSTADEAKTTAETAQSTANNAKTTAETAQSTANRIKPDWNETSTTSPKYIANRPCYYVKIETEQRGIIPDSSVLLEGTQLYWHGSFASQSNAPNVSGSGKKYRIKDDTRIYVCKAYRTAEYAYYNIIGNAALVSDHLQLVSDGHGNPIPNTGEDWAYVTYDTSLSSSMFAKTKDYKQYEKLYEVTETIKTLDPVLLPPTIQRVGDDVILNSSTAGSTKKFKITVDDTGAISATEVTT